MNRPYIALVLLLVNWFCAGGQTKSKSNSGNKSFMDIGIQGTYLLTGTCVGFNYNWGIGVGKRFAIGPSVSCPLFYTSTDNSYGYTTTKPKLGYFLFGATAELKLIDSKKCNLYVSVNNGGAGIMLGDGNHLSGGGHGWATPNTLGINVYYALQPGLHLAFKDQKENAGFHFRIGYNLFYGPSDFNNAAAFNNISASIGLGGLFSHLN